ncbi:MAG: gamma-glutamyl-gamma-aminobutyrate hydrolase family protein [Candidatus Eremiobacteraeota bacterium]|nr:gamma-glutamyl-gamma-aminobutyrate hydrolase family protein [Candidatus Eremiobacteraeota bacterium]
MLRIGLSYDQGTPKYTLYRRALLEAASRYGYQVDAVWLADRGSAAGRDVLERLDGIVLTGGADVTPSRYGFDDPDGVCIHALPERDEAELPFVEFAIERRLPTLAICRGMQFLNVALGGTLIPDLPDHETDDDTWRHVVNVQAGSHLAEVMESGPARVSSSHHQAVDRAGNGLRIVALADDGIVEAIEWADPANHGWLAAVQWHPERMHLDEPASGRLYSAFLAAVASQKQMASIS